MKLSAIKKEEIEDYVERLLDFYEPLYKMDRDYYRKAIQNSGIICFAAENEKIIGCCRILTDFTKHAHIVDFIVQPSSRGRGLGKKLIAFAGAECKKMGCRYIGLTCRPELIDFYKKADFGPEEGFEYMKYKG